MRPLTVSLVLTLPIVFAATPNDTMAPQTYSFHRQVANIEYVSQDLREAAPGGVAVAPEASGQFWYGQVMRRLTGEGPRESGHYVPFAVTYTADRPEKAWIDSNLNGTLADDQPSKLDVYPPIPGARSFLASMKWTTRNGDGQIPVDWLVRIVLEPRTAGTDPRARVQHVYAMVGSMRIEGHEHRAFLYDGNGDGLYSRDFFEGFFVDLDDDGHFEVDEMSREFGPFAVPFQMGSRVYEVTAVEPDGSEITLAENQAVAPLPLPVVGEMAPDFVYRDTEGKQIRLGDLLGKPVLLHFWASWCGVSAAQVPALRQISDRFVPAGLRILSVSYDTERPAMEGFRKKHQLTWPTTFSGRMFWEDPIGRLYQARGPGALFLIDGNGRLVSAYEQPEKVAARLAEMLGSAQVGGN